MHQIEKVKSFRYKCKEKLYNPSGEKSQPGQSKKRKKKNKLSLEKNYYIYNGKTILLACQFSIGQYLLHLCTNIFLERQFGAMTRLKNVYMK